MGNVAVVAPEKFSQILSMEMPKYLLLCLFVVHFVDITSDRADVRQLSSPAYFVRLDNIPG
jgi:hypothetical protein